MDVEHINAENPLARASHAPESTKSHPSYEYQSFATGITILRAPVRSPTSGWSNSLQRTWVCPPPSHSSLLSVHLEWVRKRNIRINFSQQSLWTNICKKIYPQDFQMKNFERKIGNKNLSKNLEQKFIKILNKVFKQNFYNFLAKNFYV
jgi:hypothetical protein